VAQDLERIAAVEMHAPHTDPLARRAMRIRRRLREGVPVSWRTER